LVIDIGIQTWVIFIAVVILLLCLDLGVFHREASKVSVRQALGWSAFWIALSLAFNAWIYLQHGHQRGLEFTAGYILEKSLSVDNLFVFLLIFSYFKVPAELQHGVLFLGILGALVLRGIFILLGVAIVQQASWVLYLFGAFLVYGGIKLLGGDDDDEANPENGVVRWVRKRIRLTDGFRGQSFFVVEDGIKKATPLLLVLVAVETSDVLFAVDSIPAVFGVTKEPFIVYTSNVMAILGLRALYFALAGLMEYFHYLNYGLGAILIFIGAKMLGEKYVHLHIGVELAIIAGLLAAAVAASLIFPRPPEQAQEGEEPEATEDSAPSPTSEEAEVTA
jgi:tellurite resistance protein TerC